MAILPVSSLELFRQYLDRAGFDTLQRDLRGSHYFADPWPHFGSFRHKLLALPTTPRAMLEHLLLGIPKASALMSDVFPPSVFRVLEQFGVFSLKSGYVYTNSMGLASFLGSYFWASLPPAYPTCANLEVPIYLGADSYRLAHNVCPPRGAAVLDLCTGSGIQAILAARSAKKCIGVDISSAACRLATLNAALNGVSGIVEIREGDLFEPVEGMIFDVIYCNPPFLAVPDGIRFPPSGSGGRDGLSIIRQVWRELHRFLKRDGVAVMWFQAVGDDTGPFCLGELQELAQRRKLTVRIVLSSRMPLSFQAELISETASTLGQGDPQKLCCAWIKLYRDLDATFLYDCLLWVKKELAFCFEQYELFSTWTPNGTPSEVLRHK